MEKSKCTADLRRSSDKFISTECQDMRFPEHTSPSSFRGAKVHSHDRSCGIHRSYASTDLLTDTHSALGQSAFSLDSLEPVLPLPLDSMDNLQPIMDAPVNPWRTQSSWLSVGELALPAGGQGRCRVGKKCLWTDFRDSCREEKKSTSNTTPPEDNEGLYGLGEIEDWNDPEEDEDSVWCKEEEEKGVSMPKAKKVVERNSIERTSKCIQEFHSFTKNVPSEITTCLYTLEEKCREVEKQTESIKWKMELIHHSLQTIQETLRTLLKRLMEGMSNGAFDSTSIPTTHQLSSTSNPCPRKSSSPTHRSQKSLSSQSNSDKTLSPSPTSSGLLAAHSDTTHLSQVPFLFIHQHRMEHGVVARKPSVTCLTEDSGTGTQAPCRCCPKSTSPGTASLHTPSCAQGEKREEALHVISELRMDIERLRVANAERQEHQETLLRAFQTDMETLLSHYQKDRQTWSNPIEKLETISRQSRNISEMTHQAVAKLGKLRCQLDGPGVVGTRVHSDSARLTPNSCQLCQHCTSKLTDGATDEK